MQTFFTIAGVFALVVLAYSFSVWLFMTVWNFVMPAVFGLPDVGFWYAAGIMFIIGSFKWVVSK